MNKISRDQSGRQMLDEILADVDEGRMTIMGRSMSATYDRDKVHEMQNIIIQKKWKNGEEMMVYVGMIAASLIALPKEYRSSFLGAMIISIALMTEDIEEMNTPKGRADN